MTNQGEQTSDEAWINLWTCSPREVGVRVWSLLDPLLVPVPSLGSGLGNADSNKGNNDKISDDGVLIVRSVGLEVSDRLAENNYVGEEIREEGEKDHLGEEHDDSQLMDIAVQAAPLGDKRGQKKKKTFVRKTRASVKGGNRVNEHEVFWTETIDIQPENHKEG
ncbi:outer membrane protein [Striga asiatica]|uniref:Outer membrane protein n=1 Tax=Striga asiatica TaxID=4170 RepID=A0A5A7PWJ1_STRAF|nr:outer membrane protein [Striga asiatica]